MFRFTIRDLLRLTVVVALAQVCVEVTAQDTSEQQTSSLEKRVTKLESSLENKSGITAVVILYAAFCGLWAQNTGRNPWLWFFLGLLFSIFTTFVLLNKNASDNKNRRHNASNTY